MRPIEGAQRVSRKLGFILTGVGVFFLALALLARFYAYDRLAVVPLDQDTVSVSEGPGATIFDIATQQEITVDLVSTRNVVGDVEASEEASDELGEDIAVWETLVYTDEPGAVVSTENPPALEHPRPGGLRPSHRRDGQVLRHLHQHDR